MNENPARKVGVQFKSGGKIYDFSCDVIFPDAGDQVVVETENGQAVATVVAPPEPVDLSLPPPKPLKKVLRRLTEKDQEQLDHNREIEQKAHAFCLQHIKSLELPMNLFSVESTFDASRLTFFFTAESRVDFRQLVKILVKAFHVRIEMRQVGIRHQAKMCGGIGRCGRIFCCTSFLEKFDPISIRMAKQQGLSLNPTKISGQCGRLMCCLTFENDIYRDLKADFPKIGERVNTQKGPGKVTRHNVICNRLSVKVENGEEVEISLNDIIA
ncbi:stage 0 sporulation family protein [Desulfosarcina sp. OttesenSCG-928-A07]|nr:stage 0 sporulation family protein [Desulfosarcina sp. OttesenSCG-928-G17]MDL2328594.1 stage 0 sporulation family protein [Desulfosarcina sp. OttesenSCG-928-A07]